MKKLSIYFLALFVGLLMFSSCEKENIDETVIEIEEIVPTTSVVNNVIKGLAAGSTEGLEFGCLTILYSFEMTTEDGDIVSFSSDEDFFDYIADSSNAFLIDFVYPLNIEDIDDDGENEVVGDIEELLELFGECIPTGGWGEDDFPAYVIDFDNSCYTIVYPMEVTDIDGNVITVNDAVELSDLLAAGDLYFFNWPLSLEDEAGEIYTAEDVDGLFTLLFECDGQTNPCDTTFLGGGFIACYQLVFPVDVVLADGSIETVEDEDEFFNLLFENQIVEFSYPINLIGPDGIEVTAEDEDALNTLIEENCGFGPGGDQFLLLIGTESPSGVGCYTINFPISFTMIDGSTLEVNNMDEYIENMEQAESLVYPLTITLSSDGTSATIESLEDIFTVLESCEG